MYLELDEQPAKLSSPSSDGSLVSNQRYWRHYLWFKADELG
jgi:hypothetical protein